MKKAVIISGGRIPSEFALAFLKEWNADLLIAADRGMEFCRDHGIVPTHIVGDFDSADAASVAHFAGEGTAMSRFPARKDETDTELSLRQALALKATHIAILGGTGSRLDHVAANIRVLVAALRAGAAACLLDEHNRIRVTDRPVVLRRAEQFGRYVSLFALGGAVKDLSLRGFSYPLSGYRLEGWDPLCVSNVITEEVADISFSEGLLLMIESTDTAKNNV